ncbi:MULTISPECIES: TetR/AcrR family transcriptional regulator [Pseudomonas]|uniref:TetR/AcrR family transcriptional regulator n=1 Tax=Pseudomonas TaxID=286 RepID=UPI002148E51A|nr:MULTISPECIES: TetR/AcrR family transcriptional regulator [Pseudomonas]UUT20939.1 TetR/AcrR family transcriptional regulator [Pseudomonas sp. T8]WJV24098.1 TetR/AcrR family transcriptional regulator [Pseudomonas chlororaphis]
MTAPDVKNARDRILEGACELFALYGYQAIGLRDLADHVGIKPGSLYHHIDSKQSLLFELMEDAISELLYCTRLNLRRKAQAHDRLNCFIDTFLSFKHSSASRANLLSREQINLTSEQANEFNGLKNEYIQILSDIIKDLIRTNRLPPLTLSMAADAVIGMLFNQAQWLNAEVNGSQQSPVLKRFAYGIIATMNIEAA